MELRRSRRYSASEAEDPLQVLCSPSRRPTAERVFVRRAPGGARPLRIQRDRQDRVCPVTEQRTPTPQAQEELESLSEEDRVWLAERLVEYKDLLEFLHAN